MKWTSFPCSWSCEEACTFSLSVDCRCSLSSWDGSLLFLIYWEFLSWMCGVVFCWMLFVSIHIIIIYSISSLACWYAALHWLICKCWTSLAHSNLYLLIMYNYFSILLVLFANILRRIYIYIYEGYWPHLMNWGKCFLSHFSGKRLYKIGFNSSVNICYNFLGKPPGSGDFRGSLNYKFNFFSKYRAVQIICFVLVRCGSRLLRDWYILSQFSSLCE